MILSDSAIFIEKKTVENWLWAKSELFWALGKNNIHQCGISFNHSNLAGINLV